MSQFISSTTDNGPFELKQHLDDAASLDGTHHKTIQHQFATRDDVHVIRFYGVSWFVFAIEKKIASHWWNSPKTQIPYYFFVGLE